MMRNLQIHGGMEIFVSLLMKCQEMNQSGCGCWASELEKTLLFLSSSDGVLFVYVSRAMMLNWEGLPLWFVPSCLLM